MHTDSGISFIVLTCTVHPISTVSYPTHTLKATKCVCAIGTVCTITRMSFCFTFIDICLIQSGKYSWYTKLNCFIARFCWVPVQLTPSPSNPSVQLQKKLPYVSVHVALLSTWQLCSPLSHSFMSAYSTHEQMELITSYNTICNLCASWIESEIIY